MKNARERVFWGAILVFIAGGLYLFLTINGFEFQRKLTNSPQAHVTVISGATIPTADLSILVAATATSSSTSINNGVDDLYAGVFVQITGTEGSGLNIRNSPELSSESNFIANESEVFQILDGPIEMDGYQWWQLAAPYDQSRQGWAVQNYLHLIQP